MTIHSALNDDFVARLTTAIDLPEDQKVAVFDADGTLWDRDMGEAFLRWLVASRKVPNADQWPDLYAEYERRVDIDRSTGYAWAVQVMAGLKEATVADWAKAFVYGWPNYRPAMKAVVEFLEKSGVECWIVSATSHTVVREAARYTGIPKERTLGMQSLVKDGILTDTMIDPKTNRQGKVDLIEKAIGVKPILAFGDSTGDLEMLETAHQAMVVTQYGKPNEELLKLAKERGWPVQIF